MSATSSTRLDPAAALDRLRAALADAGPGHAVSLDYDVAAALAESPAEGFDEMPVALELAVDPDYSNRRGYDGDFLGVRVPLPRLGRKIASDAVTYEANGSKEHVLPYHHFSIVMSKSRRLARFTAVNIDARRRFQIDRTADRWAFDPRIDRAVQIGGELYTHNDLDRGHLVRRQDPDWGKDLDEARRANDDTFHFTNCSPQHKHFNQNTQTWHGLEDYILNNAAHDKMRVSVFSGPVLADDDPVYRQVRIPRDFWKVVATVGPRRKLHSSAYLLSQADLVATLEELVFGPYRTFQVPVTRIEELTGLGFAKLRSADAFGAAGAEEGREVEALELRDLSDVRL